MNGQPCHECGATWTRKGPDGCCAWTGGCEHRLDQAAAEDAAFEADYAFHFEPLDCGHTPAEHVEQWRTMFTSRIPPSVQRFMDPYDDDDPG